MRHHKVEALRNMGFHYTPFPGKELAKLESADLDVLREVHEGWYVEYKRELPQPKNIAKAIAAFANTHGGWLFIGIAEKSKSENVAGLCPGLPRAEMDAALQSIRQSTNHHINPTPHFDVAVIWGPNEAMNLPLDHGVICIAIPQSPLAPHIHSSGVIFRRVEDSSEPKPENDRHQLELMWKRREAIHEEYRDWIERAPELSKGESERPYLRLLLEADLYRSRNRSWDLSVEDVRGVLNDHSTGPGIPMQAVYPSSLGIVARQTSGLERHENFGLTWIVGRGLRCEVWIPINSYPASDPDDLLLHCGRYQNIGRFIEQLKAARASNSHILDLNQVFMVLHAIANMYWKLLNKAQANTDMVHAKALMGNIWRTTPFLNSSKILDRMHTSGLPLCLAADAAIPSGRDAESFSPIQLPEPAEGPELLRSTLMAVKLFELVCRAVGLQGLQADNSREDFKELLQELLDGWKRSQPDSEEQD